jgi:hypothetical protein
MKFFKKRVFLDKILLLFVFAMFWFFRPDYVVMVTCILLVPYLYLTKREDLLKHYGLALLISGLWIINARKYYSYNYEFLNIAGITFYPFFSWSAGLLATYLIFEYYRDKIKNKDFRHQFTLYVLVSWILLLFGETVAYHVFDVKNIASVAYSGLPICDCIHAPAWMKIFYFLIGPLFFVISCALGWENSRNNKEKRIKPKAF